MLLIKHHFSVWKAVRNGDCYPAGSCSFHRHRPVIESNCSSAHPLSIFLLWNFARSKDCQHNINIGNLLHRLLRASSEITSLLPAWYYQLTPVIHQELEVMKRKNPAGAAMECFPRLAFFGSVDLKLSLPSSSAIQRLPVGGSEMLIFNL